MSITSPYVPELFNIVHETSVDFSYRRVVKPIHLVQYDSLIPVIAVSLYYKGLPYHVPDSVGMDISMKVRWEKKNRASLYKNVLGLNDDRSVVYFSIDSEISSEYGEYNPILELIITVGEATNKVGSSAFTVIFERNPMQVV